MAAPPRPARRLTGDGVHVLTFNDYLAHRDAEWMGPVYRMLGLSVDAVQQGMTPAARRRAYRADVTYVTAREAGFDYLRDLRATDPLNGRVKTGHLWAPQNRPFPARDWS